MVFRQYFSAREYCTWCYTYLIAWAALRGILAWVAWWQNDWTGRFFDMLQAGSPNASDALGVGNASNTSVLGLALQEEPAKADTGFWRAMLVEWVELKCAGPAPGAGLEPLAPARSLQPVATGASMANGPGSPSSRSSPAKSPKRTVFPA